MGTPALCSRHKIWSHHFWRISYLCYSNRLQIAINLYHHAHWLHPHIGKCVSDACMSKGLSTHQTSKDVLSCHCTHDSASEKSFSAISVCNSKLQSDCLFGIQLTFCWLAYHITMNRIWNMSLIYIFPASLVDSSWIRGEIEAFRRCSWVFNSNTGLYVALYLS